MEKKLRKLLKSLQNFFLCCLLHLQQQMKVLTICSDAEFREADDFHSLPFCLDNERLHLLDVVLTVGNLYAGYCRCNFDKSVVHIRSCLKRKQSTPREHSAIPLFLFN